MSPIELTELGFSHATFGLDTLSNRLLAVHQVCPVPQGKLDLCTQNQTALLGNFQFCNNH